MKVFKLIVSIFLIGFIFSSCQQPVEMTKEEVNEKVNELFVEKSMAVIDSMEQICKDRIRKVSK